MLHRLRQLAQSPKVAWLILALLARGLIADGFMPGDGDLVQLCTPQGVVQMQWDPVSGKWQAHEAETEHRACDWSLTPSAACDWAAGAAPTTQATLTPSTRWADYPTPPSRHLTPPSRAPPAIA